MGTRCDGCGARTLRRRCVACEQLAETENRTREAAGWGPRCTCGNIHEEHMRSLDGGNVAAAHSVLCPRYRWLRAQEVVG
jgi:hypothetical protein